MANALVPAPAARASGCAPGGGGSGTSEAPFLISNTTQLAAINTAACLARGIFFRQTRNIDLSGAWTPIGNSTTEFGGTYDGGGYTITGLRVSDMTYGGLFGYAVGAALRNMNLTDVNLSLRSDGVYVGGVAGLAEDVEIRDSTVSGVINGKTFVGGIVGFAEDTSVFNSTANVTVAGENYVGGLAGRMIDGSVINNSAITGFSAVGSVGDSLSRNYVGGVVGSMNGSELQSLSSSARVSNNRLNAYVGGVVGDSQDSNITDVHASGEVLGFQSTGGLAGAFQITSSGTANANLANATASGNVSGVLVDADSINVGGLIGLVQNRSSPSKTLVIEDSYATGAVEASGQIGGLVGYVSVASGQSVTLRRSFATGRVSGRQFVGGFAGRLTHYSGDLAVVDSFATGAVHASGRYDDETLYAQVGSFAGEIRQGSVTNVYGTGAVTASAGAVFLGGVAGRSSPPPTVAGAYWNSQTTGMSKAVGTVNNAGSDIEGAAPLSSAQMRSSSSFTGWDFTSVWGYQCGVSTTPELRWANPLATSTSAGPCPSPDPGPSTPSSPTETPSSGQPEKETPTRQTPPSDIALAPGSASMLIGGQPVDVQQTPQRRGQGIELIAGPVTFQLRSQAPSGRSVPTSPDGSLVIARSGTLPITGDGLLPGSLITQTLNSDPIDLGSTTVGTVGTFSSDTSIPASVPKGDHTLSLTGTTKDGDPFTLAIGVVVTSPAAALGASPIVTTTPKRLLPGAPVTVKATGVQARCTVTFTLGNNKSRTTADARGIAVTSLTVPAGKGRRMSITTKVSGKGCEPVALTRSLRR